MLSDSYKNGGIIIKKESFLRSKSARNGKLFSILITALVIAIYLFPNFVNAVSVEVKTDKAVYANGNDIVTFNLAVDIQDLERVPVRNLTLQVNGALKNCIFKIDGSPISGCQNMQVIPNVQNDNLVGQLNGTGFSSVDGLAFSNVTTDFGYGYGVGPANARQGFNGELAYTILWNITADGVLDGNYNANLFAHASNGDTDAIYKKKNDVNFLVEKNTSGCFSSLQQLPASCSVGQVISDSFANSCRQITCSNGVSNTTALACEKPNNTSVKSHFEMYTTGHFGSNVEVCIANTTCVNSNGFAVSPNYPICIGTIPPVSCPKSVFDLNDSCTGTITSDTKSLGCRKIVCENGNNSVSVLACDKPNNAKTKTSFEMYKKNSTGTAPKVCLGDACIQKNGFASSEIGCEQISASLTIKKPFPQGKNYVFVCSAQGFTATSFDWTFGDGQKQLNSNNMNVWHTYAASGHKTVQCTGKNGGQSAAGSLNIVVA